MDVFPTEWSKVLFKGSFKHTIDVKGRIIIPSKLKRSISVAAEDTLVMLPGRDRCIELYPKDVWIKMEESLAKLNSNDPQVLKLIRYYAHNAHEDELDSQGRILIPAHLKKYAGIESEIMITGMFHHIEVWNSSARDEVVSDNRDDIDKIAATHWQWNF